jgi:hydrogenase small subunit
MTKEIPLVWLGASGCTGCSVSLLKTASPTIKNLLVDEIIPGVHINLRFHQTIMAASGDIAIEALESTARDLKGSYILVVDGAIPTGDCACYCLMGERDGKPVTMETRLEELARDALAVLAVGTCASFGGLPAGKPNPSNCAAVKKVLDDKGIETPLVNVPGCPPHPDWIVGTIAGILLNGLPKASDLDDYLRPLAFYGKLIHENCPRRAISTRENSPKNSAMRAASTSLAVKAP